MGRFCAIALLVAACDARLGARELAIDAQGNGSGGGSGSIDAPAMVSIDAPGSACFNGRVVFLNFDGVTLTQAMTDDATLNQASWIGVATATIPVYHSANTDRATQIAQITSDVQTILGGFPITVVTTRPATGPYVMIAFGGNSQTVGTIYSGAASYHDCGDLVKSDVGWVDGSVSIDKASDNAVGAIGWALGLQGTNDPTDCMCNWANSCQLGPNHCSLHGPIATLPSLSPATTCPGLTSQDENAAFSQAFCQ